MLLNDLDTTLRNAGLAVTEADGWVGHNHGAMTSVECVVIHHTGTPGTSGDYPTYNTVRNGRSDLPGPLAQLGCGRSGRMYVFSNGVAYHAGVVKATWQDNQHAIGIECESPGDGTPWPQAQVHAAARASAALCRRYGVPSSRVLGHKEVCYPVGRKPDPVGIPGDMSAFRTLVQKYINNPQENDVEPTDIAKDPGGGRWGWYWLNTQANALNVRNSMTNTVIPGVTAAKAAADAAKAAVAGLAAKVDALSAKVDGIQSGTVNVDVDAFVAQLVPNLSQALRAAEDRAARDGDPTTGPVS